MLEKVESTLDELGLHTMSELLSSQCEQSLAKGILIPGVPGGSFDRRDRVEETVVI